MGMTPGPIALREDGSTASVSVPAAEPQPSNMGRQIWLLAACSAAITTTFALVPSLPLGFRAPALHVALETAAALIAFLAAFLVLGRLRREGRVPDLLLTCGLAILALSNFGFRTVPAVVDPHNSAVVVWGAVGGRVFGAALLAAAAIAPRRRIRDHRGATRLGVVGSAALVAAAGLIAWLLRDLLPGPASVAPGARASAAHPELTVDPGLMITNCVSGALYALAAVGFGMRAIRRGDDFLRWLALACVLAVFSRVNYVLYPSSYTDWVYLGDWFRLGFFALLLVAALREIAAYWRVTVAIAGLAERRRLARDLHDGLAQELSFLRGNIASMQHGEAGRDLVERLSDAARRAELESRQLLAALAGPGEDALDIVLGDVIREVADREQAPVDVDAAPGIRLGHVQVEALVRIAAEAVTNAARHAQASDIRVSVEQVGGRVRLRVRDDGRGFDADAPPRGGRPGFGLISMHGRARAVGARLSVSSRPGRGTVVEVEL
jgi:signal transduction histidine kinase